jgi:hypothetical protein
MFHPGKCNSAIIAALVRSLNLSPYCRSYYYTIPTSSMIKLQLLCNLLLGYYSPRKQNNTRLILDYSPGHLDTTKLLFWFGSGGGKPNRAALGGGFGCYLAAW